MHPAGPVGTNFSWVDQSLQAQASIPHYPLSTRVMNATGDAMENTHNVFSHLATAAGTALYTTFVGAVLKVNTSPEIHPYINAAMLLAWVALNSVHAKKMKVRNELSIVQPQGFDRIKGATAKALASLQSTLYLTLTSVSLGIVLVFAREVVRAVTPPHMRDMINVIGILAWAALMTRVYVRENK